METKQHITFTFPTFNYEARVVPNGIYALQVLDGQIICGMSSGHIAIGKTAFKMLKVHNKGIRSLQIHNKDIISVSNDGRCCLTDIKTKQVIELQSVHSDKEYIFCSCVFKNKVVFGGTSIVAEVIDLATQNLQQLIPMQSDAWSVCYYGNKLIFGLEDGSIVTVDLNEDPNKFFRMQISSQKFTGNASDYLPIQMIKEKFSFNKVEDVNEYVKTNLNNYQRCTPLCICFVDNTLQCLLWHKNSYHTIGNVDYKTLSLLKKKDKQGRDWDLCFDVNADVASEKSFQLFMNVGEDAYVVAKRFLADTGIQLNGKSDEIDQVAQIRQFIDQNAPKVTLLEQYRPDSTLIQNHLQQKTEFEEIKAESQDVERSKMEIDLRNHCFPDIRQTSEQIAQKALVQLQIYFNDLELEDICNLLAEGTFDQFNEFNIKEEHYGQFLCILSYAFQIKAVTQLDDKYVEFLIDRFLMGSKPEQVFSLRTLNYIVDERVYKRILGCQSAFNLKMKENDGQDVEFFVVQMSRFQLRKVFGDSDFVKDVAEGFFVK